VLAELLQVDRRKFSGRQTREINARAVPKCMRDEGRFVFSNAALVGAENLKASRKRRGVKGGSKPYAS
jgi:hypothetical protein